MHRLLLGLAVSRYGHTFRLPIGDLGMESLSRGSLAGWLEGHPPSDTPAGPVGLPGSSELNRGGKFFSDSEERGHFHHTT